MENHKYRKTAALFIVLVLLLSMTCGCTHNSSNEYVHKAVAVGLKGNTAYY